MITKYTFSLKNNNKNTNTFCSKCAYCTKSTDYSKMLDDLINADIKEKNPWLYGYNNDPDTKTIKIKIKANEPTDLIDAFVKESSMNNVYEFFKGYKFSNKKCPFIKDKIYYLADGTPFYLTDDYITIGFNTYYFYEFGNPIFINGLTDSFKKTIATIYIDGLKITIKK